MSCEMAIPLLLFLLKSVLVTCGTRATEKIIQIHYYYYYHDGPAPSCTLPQTTTEATITTSKAFNSDDYQSQNNQPLNRNSHGERPIWWMNRSVQHYKVTQSLIMTLK
jgi:hypothetical protein